MHNKYINYGPTWVLLTSTTLSSSTVLVFLVPGWILVPANLMSQKENFIFTITYLKIPMPETLPRGSQSHSTAKLFHQLQYTSWSGLQTQKFKSCSITPEQFHPRKPEVQHYLHQPVQWLEHQPNSRAAWAWLGLGSGLDLELLSMTARSKLSQAGFNPALKMFMGQEGPTGSDRNLWRAHKALLLTPPLSLSLPNPP